jgi:GH15 family glucan-1,4-alpha-glucosidase
MGNLNPTTESIQKHIYAIEKALKTEQGLIYRYRYSNDFGTPESTFLVCAFWYAEALACVGRVNEADNVLQNLVKTGNHLGLFSDDVAIDGSQWRNFLQTNSHVGLMNAAFRIV